MTKSAAKKARRKAKRDLMQQQGNASSKQALEQQGAESQGKQTSGQP